MFHPLLLTQRTGRVIEYGWFLTVEEKAGLREERRSLLVLVWSCGYCKLRACLDATVLLRSPIQMILFILFRNGDKAIFTAKTVAQLNGAIFAKRAMSGVGGEILD